MFSLCWCLPSSSRLLRWPFFCFRLSLSPHFLAAVSDLCCLRLLPPSICFSAEVKWDSVVRRSLLLDHWGHWSGISELGLEDFQGRGTLTNLWGGQLPHCPRWCLRYCAYTPRWSIDGPRRSVMANFLAQFQTIKSSSDHLVIAGNCSFQLL